MKPEKKKPKPPQCSQCGRKRGVKADPCSRPCEEFKANHEFLMQRIEAEDKAKKEARK